MFLVEDALFVVRQELVLLVRQIKMADVFFLKNLKINDTHVSFMRIKK